MRSPHLKRNSDERSPKTSPRKTNSSQNAPMQAQVLSKPINALQLQQQQQYAQFQMRQQQQQHQQQLTNSQKQSKARLGRDENNSSQVSGGATEVDGDAASSDEDSDHINVEKLKTIRNKAAQRCQQQQQQKQQTEHMASQDADSSAVVIQKIWRGYQTRKKAQNMVEKLQKQRTHEYIDKLTKDMEMTKVQLENERKIQQLQMQAINALWKKVSTMNETNSNNTTAEEVSTLEGVGSSGAVTARSGETRNEPASVAVVDLAKTCIVLTNQVQQLQSSMHHIMNYMNVFSNLPPESVKKLLAASLQERAENGKLDSAATQTEIIAVHTPQIENQNTFPFSKIRPSSLPLESQQAAGSSRHRETNERDNSNAFEGLRRSPESINLIEKTDDNEKE